MMTSVQRYLLLLGVALAFVLSEASDNLAQQYDNLAGLEDENAPNSIENLLAEMYLDDMIKNENDQMYENPDALKSHFTDYVNKRFSEFLGGKRKRFSEFLGGKKRFSEFLGGKKRFSEFLGGKKRFSEFLGGKKRFSEFLGGKKRFSEFLGGKKRFSEFLGGKKRFSEFLGGKRDARSIPDQYDVAKRDLDFLGGR